MRSSKWTINLAAATLLCAVGASGAQAEGEAEGESRLAPLYNALSNNGEGYDLSDAILGPDSQYDFGGWLAIGYTSQKTGQFNSHNNINVTQAWLYFAREMDTSEGFDWGFRLDTMVGTDAADTQAFGNPNGSWDFDSNANWGKYGVAVPQLYAELGYKDFSIKGGHFYTPVGYEVVTAPDNFFYSHAFTMYFSEPFTHTGVLGTYSGIDGVTLSAGWTAGWDTGFDQLAGGSSFLGVIGLEPTDWATLTYTFMAGDMGWIGDGYNHSVVADIAVTENLNYVFQSDFVSLDTAKDPVTLQNGSYDTIGINQYLFYTITDKVSVGGRGEWYRNDKVDYYSLTAGVNIKPIPNLVLRPEFRYQFSPEVEDDPANYNPIGVPIDQAAVAFDVILTF